MSVSSFNSPEEVEAYLKEIRMKYHFGCFREKDAHACHLLGDWYVSRKMYKEAVEQYKVACEEHKFPRSCFKYASGMMMDYKGDKNELIGKALEYTKLSCSLGEKEACFATANLYEKQGETQKALKYYEQYCDMSHFFSDQACHHISTMYMDGKKLPKDMQKGHDYAVKACDLDNPYSCWNLHLMYKNGDGVKKDMNISEKYKEKAESIRNVLTGAEKKGSY